MDKPGTTLFLILLIYTFLLAYTVFGENLMNAAFGQ